MKKTYNTLVFAFICLFLTLYIAIGIFLYPIDKGSTQSKIEITTDTIVIRDTIIIEDIQPITEIKYKDKFIRDTVFVENTPIVADIPFEEKTYSDERFTAVISGFEPNLEKIEIYTKDNIINNEIKTTVYKQKRFSYGLQVGCGYGIINRKPDIFVGIGLQYNF